MKILATNILWDTDDDNTVLPTSVEIPPDIITDGVDAIGDWLSDEYGYCHQAFSLTNESNTFLYLVSFNYISDRSSLSANIPDAVACLYLVESEINLNNIPVSKIKNEYRIEEIYNDNDCDGISIQEIELDEYLDMMSDLDSIYFEKCDITI